MAENKDTSPAVWILILAGIILIGMLMNFALTTIGLACLLIIFAVILIRPKRMNIRGDNNGIGEGIGLLLLLLLLVGVVVLIFAPVLFIPVAIIGIIWMVARYNRKTPIATVRRKANLPPAKFQFQREKKFQRRFEKGGT